MINHYAFLCAGDFTQPDQPWLRAMYFQGSFTMSQAKSFFRAHSGYRDHWVYDPPLYFSGPVEVLMFVIPPEEHLPKLAKTAEVFRQVPTNGYCSAYDWAIAQKIITSLWPDTPLHICVIGHQWWRYLT